MGGREFGGGGLKFFGKGPGGKAGISIFFLHLLKKRKHCFVDFFVKEDHLNYSGHPKIV